MNVSIVIVFFFFQVDLNKNDPEDMYQVPAQVPKLRKKKRKFVVLPVKSTNGSAKSEMWTKGSLYCLDTIGIRFVGFIVAFCIACITKIRI